MDEQDFFRLQHSETSIALMAAQILSAFISSGKITGQTEEALVDKSLSLAISIARKAEDWIESDSEKTKPK